MKKNEQDIDLINERIEKFKETGGESLKSGRRQEFAYATKTGLRVGTEMLSGVIVGAGIGYFLDKFLDTKPCLLIVFLMLGGFAGFLNVYRFAKLNEKEE